MRRSPINAQCKSCGAPLGYNIIAQSYACSACGATVGVAEEVAEVRNWRSLASQEIQAQKKIPLDRQKCPGCGATVLFPEGEASQTCNFCQNKLVREEFKETEDFPELIIPFVLTKDEAKARLLKYVEERKDKKLSAQVRSTIKQFEGYYLPYEFVRGPVYGTVTRDQTNRKYRCGGFIEGCAVSSSVQMDNEVLDAMEPFDWSKAEDFRYEFIANQKTKLADLSGKGKENRIMAEIGDHFQPDVEKVLQTKGIDITLDSKRASNDMESIPVLLPVYVLTIGKKVTIAINGQTGRIAMGSTKKRDYSKLWVIEPAILTVILSLLFCIGFGMPLGAAIQAYPVFLVFGAILFVGYGDGRGSITKRLIRRSENARAERINRELKITEGKDVLKNPFPNTPVFYEDVEGRQNVPVKIRFYTLGRSIKMLLLMFVVTFLPMVIAAPFRLLAVIGSDEGFLDHFNIMGGAVWYIIGFFISLIYWIRMVRQGVYDRPILYEIMPDGRTRHIRTPKKPQDKEAMKNIKEALLTPPFLAMGAFMLLCIIMGVILILEIV